MGCLFKKRTTMKKIVLVVITYLLSFYSNAQSSDSSDQEGVKFKLSLNYNSGLNFYGRTDSLKSTGIFPLAEIWFNPKFYINAAPVFVNNALQTMEYAGSVASIGFLDVSDKWISNLYLLKPFYTENSRIVQSALKGQAGASFTALTKTLNFSFGGDVKYSDRFDFGAMVGIDHIFRFENKDNSIIVLDPSFTVNAGTQNFSKTYKKRTGVLLPREQQITESYQKFNLLSFEASMPVIFSKNQFQFIVTPAYVLPKNLVKVENRPDLTETGQNMFYSSFAVKYTF
jgi:hypothetical protein